MTAFSVDHSPIKPAVGYKFEYAGRTLVISGDTARTDSVVEQARGADVLVHEVLQPDIIKRFEEKARESGQNGMAKIMSDIPDYHTSPEEAAQLANAAGVKYLLVITWCRHFRNSSTESCLATQRAVSMVRSRWAKTAGSCPCPVTVKKASTDP